MRKSSHETLQERFLEWAIIRIEPSTAAVAMFVARMHRDGDCTHSGSLNSEYTSPFRSRVLNTGGSHAGAIRSLLYYISVSLKSSRETCLSWDIRHA